MKLKNLYPVTILVIIIGIMFQLNKNETLSESSPYESLPICNIKPNSIYDGDTLRAVCNGQEIKIRFACIDAPELKQPGGIFSRDYLRSLLSQVNHQSKIQAMNQDRYGRTVAQLWINLDGWKLLQNEQAKAGTVWAYDAYQRDCPNYTEVESSFNKAKMERRGIFNQNAVPPWKWRRR